MDDALPKPGQSIRPKIELNEAKNLLEKIYGLECVSIKCLEGYDDRNYHVQVKLNRNEHIDVAHEEGYVLKIMNSLDSDKTSIVEAQNQILLHLCKKAICCPEPTPTTTGDFYSLEKLESGVHVVRLMKYISGTILCKENVPEYIYYEIGEFAAKLDKELSNYKHEAYTTYKNQWMLESVPDLKQFLFAIKDHDKYLTILRIIDEFTLQVLRYKNDFERGLIHGDFNEHNIVINKIGDKWKVKGILDFGDNQYSCYMFELAVAMTYMMILENSVEIGGVVLAGYHSIRKISLKEFKLLKLCIEARLCQSLVLGAYSSMQDPDNDYILTTAKPGWILLKKLASMSNEDVLKIWNEAAAKYSKDFEFKD